MSSLEFDYEFWRDILRRWGPAVYVAHGSRLRENLVKFRQAVGEYYSRVQLGYSYKTNYLPYFCRIAHHAGAYAEVVSGLELEMALRLGIPGERIIFNGPSKSQAEIDKAISHQVVLNLDSDQEIDYLIQTLKRRDAAATIGLRANFPLTTEHRSRFGFDAVSGHLQAAFARLERLDRCRIAGLHCHFSHFRDAPSYGRRVRTLIELAQALFPHAPPDFIDVGGGFCGEMPEALRRQFPTAPATFADYAAEIGPAMAAAFGRDGGPELILEPGMAVIANAVDFATEVTAVKQVGDQAYAGTAGSIYNVKPTMNKMNLPMTVLSASPRSEAADDVPVDIVGYTCMEIDALYHDYPHRLNVSDILIFHNVGAYTTVLLPPFIRAAPAVIAIQADHTAIPLRRAQSLDGVWNDYVTEFSPGELGSASNSSHGS